MKTNTLFNVLVVGGGLLAAGAAVGNQGNEAPPTIPGFEAGAQTFCQPKDPKSCVEKEDGSFEPKPGLVCCWGTSCNG